MSALTDKLRGIKKKEKEDSGEDDDKSLSILSDQAEIVKVEADVSNSLSLSAALDDSQDNKIKTPKKSKPGKAVFRRKQTIKDQRSYIDKYVDTFWAQNIEDKDLSVGEID